MSTPPPILNYQSNKSPDPRLKFLYLLPIVISAAITVHVWLAGPAKYGVSATIYRYGAFRYLEIVNDYSGPPKWTWS